MEEVDKERRKELIENLTLTRKAYYFVGEVLSELDCGLKMIHESLRKCGESFELLSEVLKSQWGF